MFIGRIGDLTASISVYQMIPKGQKLRSVLQVVNPDFPYENRRRFCSDPGGHACPQFDSLGVNRRSGTQVVRRLCGKRVDSTGGFVLEPSTPQNPSTFEGTRTPTRPTRPSSKSNIWTIYSTFALPSFLMPHSCRRRQAFIDLVYNYVQCSYQRISAGLTEKQSTTDILAQSLVAMSAIDLSLSLKRTYIMPQTYSTTYHSNLTLFHVVFKDA